MGLSAMTGEQAGRGGDGGHSDADTNQNTARQKEQDDDRAARGQSWLVNTTLGDRHKCLLYVWVCACGRACVCVSLRACV